MMIEVLSGVLGAFGLSASAGLNAYIPLLAVALLAKFSKLIVLSKPWDALTSWWVIGILAVLCIVEALADKFPVVDHINNIVQSFIRPIAGALLFAASAKVITDIHPVISLLCGLLIAGTVNVVKSAAVRPMVTATTAGAGDPIVSALEDVVAVIVSVLSVAVPILMLVVLALLVWWIIWFINRRKKTKIMAI